MPALSGGIVASSRAALQEVVLVGSCEFLCGGVGVTSIGGIDALDRMVSHVFVHLLLAVMLAVFGGLFSAGSGRCLALSGFFV